MVVTCLAALPDHALRRDTSIVLVECFASAYRGLHRTRDLCPGSREERDAEKEEETMSR